MTWKLSGMGSGLESPLGNTRRNKKHRAGKPEHRQKSQVPRFFHFALLTTNTDDDEILGSESTGPLQQYL
jgi:hypothetical protein